jgi:hypothetical protein
MLSLIGLTEHYNNKMVITLDFAHSKIIEYYSTIWKNGIENMSKLKTLFKTEFETEKYVSLSMKRNKHTITSCPVKMWHFAIRR